MALFSGYCTFSDSSVVSLKSLPWSKYTQYGTIFQKNHLLKSNSFSSSNLFFIRLFLTITWKKIGGHRACFPTICREGWAWFWVAGTGTRYKIKLIVFKVCTRDQACFRTWIEHNKYHGMSLVKIWWDFGVTNLYFRLFCIAGVLCSSEVGFDFFAFAQQCLTKKLEGKTVDRFLFFICSLVWFLYTAKCEFSSRPRVYWSPSRGSGATVGLICSRNIRLSTLGVWTTYVQ